MSKFDHVDCGEMGIISLRRTNKDGTFHRETRTPDDPIEDLSEELQVTIHKHWTKTRVAEFEKYKKQQANAAVPTQDDYVFATQNHINAVAQSRGYNDGYTIASYATSTIDAWREEAQTFIAWRDLVWIAAYAALNAVQNGEPSITEFIAELPEIEWSE